VNALGTSELDVSTSSMRMVRSSDSATGAGNASDDTTESKASVGMKEA
jgi:hypothetical protein